MGMNIHIVAHPKGSPLDLRSLDLTDCATLPRFTDQHEFMTKFRAQNCKIIERCGCLERSIEHDYYCDRDSISRPLSFDQLRFDVAHLQDWTRRFIDWLEANPNAWLQYD